MRFDLQVIASWIEPEAKVLDLGCRTGSLLMHLTEEKGIKGTGIELDEDAAGKAIAKGLSVIHGDIYEEIEDYPDNVFDYVILSQTLQQVADPAMLIREMLRVGRCCVVSFPNFTHYKPIDVVIKRGRGVWVWDVEGRKYLDCLSAYSAVNQGHCHPKILAALTTQAERLTLTSRAFRNDQLGPLYKELCDLTNSHKVLPMNSGAEAVETAIKAVRKWGYQIKGVPENRAEIIVCRNNFHGRTISIISFSTDPISTTGFGPFTPGFTVIDFGDAAALEAAITKNTVAFLVEPIQGEAGVIIPPDGYLRDVRRICDEHAIVLICDEIQTGLGRTGKLLAEEHEGVEADLTLIGKALSGGFYPVSAVLSNTEILGVLKPGEHGSTFGGNPLACAVARAALAVLREENLIENAATMGEYFMKGLKAIGNPKIKEVRGRGLLIGLEFHKNTGGARQYCEKLKEAGVLCKETHKTIVRFAPPLVITKDEVDWALERITPVLSA